MPVDVDPRLPVAVGAGLFFFALFYNTLVARWSRAGYGGLLTAGYLLVSLGGLALIHWPAAAMALAALLPGGLYLLVRDLQRTMQAHEDERRFNRIERAAAIDAAKESLDGHSAKSPSA